MTTVCSVWKDVATQADIQVEEVTYKLDKVVTPHYDSDGTVNWQDDNRYLESYTVTGTVTKADEEDLRAAAKIVMGATYPKVRVYDKSANPFYNDYSPVQFTNYSAVRITHDEWRVTCTFKW